MRFGRKLIFTFALASALAHALTLALAFTIALAHFHSCFRLHLHLQLDLHFHVLQNYVGGGDDANVGACIVEFYMHKPNVKSGDGAKAAESRKLCEFDTFFAGFLFPNGFPQTAKICKKNDTIHFTKFVDL